MIQIIKVKDIYKKHIYALVLVLSMIVIGLVSIPAFNVFGSNLFDNIYRGLLLISARNGLALQEVHLSGNRFVSDQKILNISDIYPNKPIVLTSPSKIMDRLQAHNGWFDRVAVRRVLPSRIDIEVIEKSPSALWRHPKRSQARLIATDGSLISLSKNDNFSPEIINIINSLPQISGDNPTIPTLWSQLRLKLSHFPHIMNNVLSANLVGSRRWNLVLRSGEIIKLPENIVGGVYEKLKILDNLQREHSILSRGLLFIDLRFNSYILVRLKNSDEKTFNTTASILSFKENS